jgi:hypothetical protein
MLINVLEVGERRKKIHAEAKAGDERKGATTPDGNYGNCRRAHIWSQSLWILFISTRLAKGSVYLVK